VIVRGDSVETIAKFVAPIAGKYATMKSQINRYTLRIAKWPSIKFTASNSLGLQAKPVILAATISPVWMILLAENVTKLAEGAMI
jgi:hypothetical protein